MLSPQRGATPVEAVFALTLLMVFAVGIVEVALALYGRNVVATSAHEGARVGVERGRSPAQAAAAARAAVRTAVGRLVDDLRVDATSARSGGRLVVSVRVVGTIRTRGPISLPVPVRAMARASTDAVR